MVLYHVSTTYQLLCSVIHKLAYHREEESRLLVVEYIMGAKDLKPFLKKLEHQEWFGRVDFVPEQQFKMKRGIALKQNSSEAQVLSAVERIAKTFEKWFDEDLRNYSKLYVASDQWSLGITLLYRNIPYIYMEDASGMLSEEERYMEITRKYNMTNYVISEYLRGAGRSEIVTEKLCDLKNQKEGFSDPKAVNFSVYDTLKYDVPERIDEIIKFYNARKIVLDETRKVCLFLTQYVKTLAVQVLDIQEVITTLLADYFCPDHELVIKPHPKDRWLNYRRIFPEATVLPSSFPSELLPFLSDEGVNMALTASSTSIGGVKQFAEESFYMGTDIETRWNRIHPMYMACQVLKYLKIKDGIEVEDINEEQIGQFFRQNGISLGKGKVLIHGGMTSERLYQIRGDIPVQMYLSLGESRNWPLGYPSDEIVLVKGKIEPDESSLLRESLFEIAIWVKEKAVRKQLMQFGNEIPLKYSKAKFRMESEAVSSNLTFQYRIDILKLEQEKIG